jgi:hypothetical protein
MSNWRTGAALTMVATAALICSGPVASASVAGPLTATTALGVSMACQGENGQDFWCDLFIGGGTAPYSTTWSGSRVTFAYTSTDSASGYCQAPTVIVSATVRDSAGQQVTVSKYFACSV